MIYLVTETWLKDNTSICKNISIEDVKPAIIVAQELFLCNYFGENFYNHILNAYDTQTLTADEILLYEKIRPAIAYRAAEMAVVELTLQFSNKGLQQFSGDNSAPVDLNSLMAFKNEMIKRASGYELRLKQWLELNKTKFPIFYPSTDTFVKPADPNEDYDFELAIY